MSDGRISRFFGRLADDWGATRRYLKATGLRRKLSAERERLEGELAAAHLELGRAALAANAAAEMSQFASADCARQGVTTAQETLAARQADVKQAEASLEAEVARHEGIVQALAGEHKGLADPLAKADEGLAQAGDGVREVERQVAEVEKELSRLGPAGQSAESQEAIEARLRDRQSARASAGAALSAAEAMERSTPEASTARKAAVDVARRQVEQVDAEIQQAQAGINGHSLRKRIAELNAALPEKRQRQATAQAARDEAAATEKAKADQLAQARQGAADAKSQKEAAVTAAKSAQAEAEDSLATAQAAADDAARQLGQAVFAAGLSDPAIAPASAAVRGLVDSIATTQKGIDDSGAQANANRSGVRRIAIKAGVVLAVVIGVVLVLILRSRLGHKGGTAEPASRPMSIEWAPVSVSKEIDAAGGMVEDASGVKLTVAPGTFARKTTVTARTTTRPTELRNDVVVRGPILELATDPPQKEYFKEPVRVTIPYKGEAGDAVTAAYWTGSSWRRFGGRRDPKAGTVTFDTLSFSTYTVMLDKWSEWPTLFIDDPKAWDPDPREVPRGAVVQLVMKLKGTPPSGLKLQGRMYAKDMASRDSGSAVEIAPDPEVPAAFAETGQARLKADTDVSSWTSYLDKQVTWVNFLVHVPEDAPLGRYDLYLTGDPENEDYKKLGWPSIVHGAIEVTNRKTFLLVIDGLHARVFEKLMTDEFGLAPPNLGMIFGSPTPKKPKVDRINLRPSKAGPDSEGVEAIRLGSGYLFPRATTIFPSYTFAGNAAIVTGRSVGKFGIPGNEFFDRNPNPGQRQGRYSFTGAYATGGGFIFGQASFLDPVKSYLGWALANGVLKCDTVYQEVTSGDLAPLGLKNLVSVHMYFGPPRPDSTKRMSADFFTQVIEFQLSSHGVEFDKDMLSQVCTALGHSPSLLSLPGGVLGGPNEPLVGENPAWYSPFTWWPTVEGRLVTSRIRRVFSLGSRFTTGLVGGDTAARKEARNAGIVTLYFASLDHAGHAHFLSRTVQETHAKMLDQYIDPMIGELLKCIDDVTLRNSLFVVVGDHGQSDMGPAIVPQLYERLEGPYKMENAVMGPRPVGSIPFTWPAWFFTSTRKVEDSDCAVAYDSGLAHVYIRHCNDSPLRKRDQWASWSDTLASPSEAYSLATNEIRSEARKGWKGKLDVVLLRLPKNADLMNPGLSNEPMRDVTQTEYYAMDPYADEPKVMRLSEYLANPDPRQCAFYQQRYGWTPADKAFIQDAIQSMNCQRTGDVVLLPHYPDFFFEYADYIGNHGGLVRNDMECAMGVAIPGLDMQSNKQVEKLVIDSVDLVTKPRVGNRDVRDIIANYYRQKADFRRAPAKIGPLTVRCGRDGANTTVEITSNDLGALGPDEGLTFFLYRTDDAKSRMEGSLEARQHGVKVFGDTKVIDPDSYEFYQSSQGRIAKNKYQIIDFYGREGSDANPNPGPFYYQVGQVRIDRNGVELGQEVRSDITGPGAAIIHVMPPPTGPREDVADFIEVKDGMGLLAAALTLDNQAWGCDGAEVVATTGNWTGYFYTGRIEGGKEYGVESVFDTGAMARVRVPHPSPGGYVKLTARGKGFSAERTLKLASLPATTQPTARRENTNAAAIPSLRERVDGLQKDINEAAARGEAAPWYQREMLEKAQFDLNRAEKSNVPWMDLVFELEAAEKAHNRSAILAIRRKMLALEHATIDIEAAHKRALLALYKANSAATTQPDGYLTNNIRDVESDLAKAADAHTVTDANAYGDIAAMALLVGDVGAFKEAMTAVVAAESTLNRSTTGSLRKFAEGIAMLSGNREEAAQLWLAADKAEVDEAPPEERPKILKRHEEESRPAWWPVTAPDKSLTPADIEGMKRSRATTRPSP